jgi:hypothetical protein
MVITEVVEGSPADIAGIQVGDKITAIEGKQVSDLARRQSFQMLAGELGTKSHLIVQRGNKKYTVAAMTRAVPQKAAREINVAEKNPGRNAAPNAPPSDLPQSQSPALDRELIKLDIHGENADQMYARLLQGLAMLPTDVKQFLRNARVYILVTQTRGGLDDTRGGCCYQTKNNRVVIPEINDSNNKPTRVERLPLTTLHELGHAYDHNNGQISSEQKYLETYTTEASAVPTGKRKQLAYFLPDGDSYVGKEMKTHSPPQECFASLFARKYYVGDDQMLDSLRAAFPNTYKFVSDQKP